MTPTQRENESSFKPQIGERVTGYCSTAKHPHDVTGEFRGPSGAKPGSFLIHNEDCDRDTNGWIVDADSIRPAPIESVEMYGTMPSELPETLPAGTKSIYGVTAKSELRLGAERTPSGRDSHGYWGDFDGCSYRAHEQPRNINWTTVPRQPPKPAPVASVGCAACGCSVPMIDRYTRPNLCGGRSTCKACHFGPTPALAAVPERPRDPYAEHRRKAPAWLCDSFGPEDSQLDRNIAASKRAQALADLDRPIRTGPLGTRDKYGQKLSLRGWPEVDE